MTSSVANVCSSFVQMRQAGGMMVAYVKTGASQLETPLPRPSVTSQKND